MKDKQQSQEFLEIIALLREEPAPLPEQEPQVVELEEVCV